jgi:hypothetical protein
MAFFCTVSGVRIVSPGIAKCAGGDVPEFDASDAAEAAEGAARASIVASRLEESELGPSAEAIAKAGAAALDELTKPPKAKPAPAKNNN